MENNNGGQEPQPSAVKPIWETAWSQTDTVETPIVDAKPIDIQTKDTTAETVIADPVVNNTLEPIKDESVEEVASKEAPDLENVESDVLEPVSELTLEDMKDVPKTYADNTFQKFAFDVLALDVSEDSIEAVKAAHDSQFVLKSKFDEVQSLTKEKLLSELNPKTAAAWNLIEMGVPEHLAFNPTAEIDGYLQLDDAVLIRATLENREDYGSELYGENEVDLEMEELASDPNKLRAKANIVRANLNSNRKEILQEQSQLVQKYTERKQQAVAQQKIEVDTKFKEALTNELTFFGLNLSKEVKDAIAKKYDLGLYDGMLNDSQARVRAILQMEYGDKFSKTSLSKAKEEGKAEIVRKLADVPPKKTGQGSVVIQSEQPKGAFANMPNVFGGG